MRTSRSGWSLVTAARTAIPAPFLRRAVPVTVTPPTVVLPSCGTDPATGWLLEAPTGLSALPPVVPLQPDSPSTSTRPATTAPGTRRQEEVIVSHGAERSWQTGTRVPSPQRQNQR